MLPVLTMQLQLGMLTASFLQVYQTSLFENSKYLDNFMLVALELNTHY